MQVISLKHRGGVQYQYTYCFRTAPLLVTVRIHSGLPDTNWISHNFGLETAGTYI